MSVWSVREVFIGMFVPANWRKCHDLVFQCMYRADGGWTFTFCLIHFLKANYLVDFHSFFFFFPSPVSDSHSVKSKGLQYVLMSTPLYQPRPCFHRTRDYLSERKWMLLFQRLCDGRGYCSWGRVLHAASLWILLWLCAAGGLKRVPHESGSGTAALSGDKVIRTGNNERERKS